MNELYTDPLESFENFDDKDEYDHVEVCTNSRIVWTVPASSDTWRVIVEVVHVVAIGVVIKSNRFLVVYLGKKRILPKEFTLGRVIHLNLWGDPLKALSKAIEPHLKNVVYSSSVYRKAVEDYSLPLRCIMDRAADRRFPNINSKWQPTYDR